MGQYEKIYKLEGEAKEDKPDQIQTYRRQMAIYFDGMKSCKFGSMADRVWDPKADTIWESCRTRLTKLFRNS
jgi:hypothetical protein